MYELLLRWVLLMIDVSVKVSFLAAVTAFLLAASRVRNSGIRHAAWLGVLAALIAMPALSGIVPGIAIPLPFQPALSVPISSQTTALVTGAPIGRPVKSIASAEMSISGPDSHLDPQQARWTSAPVHTDARPASIDLGTRRSVAAPPQARPIVDSKLTAPNVATRLMEYLPVFTATWLIGVHVLLIRLVLSIRITHRLAERSTSIPDTEAFRATVANILGPNWTKLSLRESSLIFVPLTIGWRDSKILLPSDWGSWSEEKLGHVLAHEITHIRRGDCWTALLTEIVTAVYWFHPLVWWLRCRLSVLAEECCDDASIGMTGNRATYARHLLEIASVLRHQRHRLNYAGLAMTHRSSVERRILAILDPNRPLSRRLTWTATLLVTGSIVSLASVAASLKPAPKTPALAVDRGDVIKAPAVEYRIAAADANDAQNENEPFVSDPEVFRINGRVTDANDNPISGAKVAIRRMRRSTLVLGKNASNLLAELTTTADGRFEHLIPYGQMPDLPENRFTATSEWIQVAANSSGQGVQIRNLNQRDPQKPLELKLVPETVIRGRILNLEGRPVAGADIRVMEISVGEAPKIDAWYAEAMKNDGGDLDEEQMLTRPRPSSTKELDRSAGTTFQGSVSTSPEVFSGAKTDADGRFVLSGIGKDHLAILQISGEGLVRTLVNVVTRPMKPVKDFSGGTQWSAGVRTFYGSDFEYIASPGIVVRGMVRDIESKKPLADVIVCTDMLAGSMMSRTGFITTTTDSDGLYQIEGLPPAAGNRLMVLPGNKPYLNTPMLPVAESVNLEPVHFDIELRKAVWVTGRAFNRITNKPIRVKLAYTPFLTNPFTKDYWQYADQIFAIAENVGDYRSDENGRFRIPVIPGRGVLAAKCEAGGYVAGFGSDQISEFQTLISNGASIDHQQLTSDSLSPFWYHSIRDLEPTVDASEIEADLPLDPGASVKLSIVDADGEPISTTFVRSINYPALQLWTLSSETVLSGLQPGKTVIFWFRQQGWKKGETPLQKIQIISADDKNESNSVVRMERTARVTGRLIDSDAKPLNGQHISIWFESDSGELHHVIQSGSIRDDGHFEIDIPVGGKYRLTGNPNGKFAILAEHLDPKAGEEIDLGEIVATKNAK